MQTKSESFQNKLQQLTEFNPALVYGFDPEVATDGRIHESETWEGSLFPTVGQVEDMLTGYLFAQNILLPTFKKGNLDELSFINYIKQLHGHLGNSLLALTIKEKSGEYSQQQALRWNPDVRTGVLIYCIFSGTKDPNLNGEDPTAVLIKFLTTELSLSKAQVLQFIALLDRLKNDPTITPRASEKKYIGNDVGLIIQEKLAVAYLTNKLSKNDKELVSKIVTVCRDPQATPQLMKDFAKTTLANWGKCNKKDIKAVSQFLTELFFQFTDIHPFPNANGRTALCLVNVFSRSIGLPSILIRNPGEKKDSSSSYSLAIKAINQTREPLANHIYQRILEAQRQPFTDAKLAEAVTLRCKLVHQLKLMQSKHPQIDINEYQLKRYQLELSYVHELNALPNDNDRLIFFFKKFLAFLTQEEKRLDQSLSKGTDAISTSTLSERLRQELSSTLVNNVDYKLLEQLLLGKDGAKKAVTGSTSTTTSTSTQPSQLKGGFFTSLKTAGNKALDAAKAEKCSDQSSNKDKTKVTGFIGTTKLSDGEIEHLKQDLSVLTKSEGWKINKNNHLESWIELHNETEAKDVFKSLNTAGVGNVIQTKRRDNQNIHVVKCSNINLSELKNKIKSNNAAEVAISDAVDSEKNSTTPQ